MIKVGDRVRCLQSSGWNDLVYGCVYVVKGLYTTACGTQGLCLEGVQIGYLSNRFELAKDDCFTLDSID